MYMYRYANVDMQELFWQSFTLPFTIHSAACATKYVIPAVVLKSTASPLLTPTHRTATCTPPTVEIVTRPVPVLALPSGHGSKIAHGSPACDVTLIGDACNHKQSLKKRSIDCKQRQIACELTMVGEVYRYDALTSCNHKKSVEEVYKSPATSASESE